jgi:voltage-gated potassium channel Kch
MTSEGPSPTDESILEAVEEEPVEEEESFDGVSLRERYGLVLLLIFVSYVLGGFSENNVTILVTALIWSVVLLATLWSPTIPSAVRRIGLVATVVLILLFLLSAMSGSDTAFGWTNLFLAVAELAALLAILARIAQHDVVTLQTVMGGIAAYALIGFTMAAVYRGLDLLFTNPLFDGISGPGDYIYFSFVTLTTVGYGDITPAIDAAQRLAVVEMFIGQVFLITLVARLVSLWGVPAVKSGSR